MNEAEKSVTVNPRLWHACAGRMIQMPLPDSNVYYFPQGHAEHAQNVDFTDIPTVNPCILCKVIDVKFMADLQTEEVYAKIMLSPLKDEDKTMVGTPIDKLEYLAKRLSTTAASSGFLSVPRNKAETIFPKLDCSKDPSDQELTLKDIRGQILKFKHVGRGTPTRHTLTAGWIDFVRKKKLVKGNLVVFTRDESGDLCVGIMRAKERREVKSEDVVKAASLAAAGQQFEVTYYPRATGPEFVVKACSVNAARHVKWNAGMRVIMFFENEDLTHRYDFTGTVSSFDDVDPFLWPKSPWRSLQVNWDRKHDLLQTMARVSPWLVDLLSDTPSSSSNTALVDPNQTSKPELDLLSKHANEPCPPLNENPTDGNTDLTIGSSSSSDCCELLLGSEKVSRGRLYLSAIESYEDVEQAIVEVCGLKKSVDSTSVTYTDSEGGGVKRMRDEDFSEFARKAKRLNIHGHDE